MRTFVLSFIYLFIAKRILALRETSNSIKYLNKKENYNEILEMSFVFNLQTMSIAFRRCRSSLSQPDIVGCRREVTGRVKKTTSVLETRKKK
jgi:ppGpp synthetase/RelA/SpoT-type nucleotidyltranferase